MNGLASLTRTAVPLVCAAFLYGCASQSQLASLRAEKEGLVAAVDAEKKLNADLAARLQLASQRAGEAERELALQHGDKPGRSSAMVSTPARSSAAGMSLEQWSRNQTLLHYDPRRRVARVDLDLTFDSADRLSLESRRALDDLADLLVTPAGSRYGLTVAGIPGKGATDSQVRQRAAGVADWLLKRGLGSDRVTTTTRTSSPLVDEEGRKLNSVRAVQLEVIELPGRVDAVANDPSRSGDGWVSSGRR
jgi:hypothetical protein